MIPRFARALTGLRGIATGLIISASLAVVPFTAGAYTFSGTANSVLDLGVGGQVVSSEFINKGSIYIGTTLPFNTYDTLVYSNLVSVPNVGIMVGSPGWLFDYEPSNLGAARPASIFFNDNLGYIEAVDPFYVGAVGILAPSKLFVTATNIINHGALVVGANGWLRLIGDNVDLSGGVMAVSAVSGSSDVQGSYNDTPSTNVFLPDVGVYDIYAGQTNLNNFSSAALWRWVTNATSTNYVATTAPPPYPQLWNGPPVPFQLIDPASDSYTNANGYYGVTATNYYGSNVVVVLASNVYKQAVFVGSLPGSTVQIGFTPSALSTNYFQTIGVLVTVPIPNPVQFLSQTAQIYVQDRLASDTGRRLATNYLTGTYRPETYLVSRVNQGLGGSGNAGSPPEANFFLDSGIIFWDGNSTNISIDLVSNTVPVGGNPAAPVSGAYAAYEGYFDTLASQPIGTINGTITNLPGRVDITADNLNLAKSLIRGEGEVVVNTPNLVSSSQAVIDCPALSLSLGNTNQNLKVQSLVGTDVTRFEGYILAWSAFWSNSVQIVITNNWTFTNNVVTNIVGGVPVVSTNLVPVSVAPITNSVSVHYHTLMLDARNVGPAQLPVTVFDFKSRSTDLALSDPMTVVQSFFIDAQSLTLNTNLTLSSYTLANLFGAANTVFVPSWTGTNAPNLLYFTNNGVLTLLAAPAEAHFGDDRALPYADFINNGTIRASSIDVDSDYVENNGSLLSAGPMTVQGDSAKLQGGSSSSGGVTVFQGRNLKFNHYSLTAIGHCYFDLTGALFDAGAGSGNTFQFQDGFYMTTKPPLGDLLGTTFSSTAPNLINSYIQVDHVWAGDDRGATASGYLNNEAIGKLVLSVASANSTLAFSGANSVGMNGLYVDELDLRNLPDYTNELVISPNLVIYFAKADVNFTPPADTNGVPQEAEEYLDGQFGGHLRWVPSFAGPNSAVAAVIVNCNGQQLSIQVNAALRNSLRIDSDGDGIVNGLDPFPFNQGNPPQPCTIGLDASALQNLAPQPFVTIAAPTQGQSILKPSVLVQGTAGGQSGQAAVYYQVNGGEWMPAASANGGANWSGSVNMSAGLNVLQAYAMDSSGQQSPTQSVDVTYVPSAPLSLSIQGVGTVGPYTNGQWLPLDNMYTLTAHPGSGYTFSSWTGDYFSTNNTLQIWMNGSKSLLATFVPPVYSPEPATYSGLFYESNQVVNFGESGGATITTSGKGSFSGKLLLGGQRFALHGKFDTYGSASVTNRIRDGGQLIVHLQMNTSDNSRITGTVSKGTWVAELEALRGVDAFAGKYTMVIPGNDDVTEAGQPYGDGFAAITVNRGKVKIRGVLADGTRMTGSTTVSQDGRCPIDVPLYGGAGQILGWLTFTNQPQPGLSGWLDWHQEPGAPRALYPGGFDLETTNVTGSAYDSSASPVTKFATGTVVFSGGELAEDLTNQVSIDSRNRVSDLTVTNKLKLKLKKSQGLFSGKLADPSNPGTGLKFNGVILQGQSSGSGCGFFLRAGQSGRVILGP